jgi:hypothetical protein
MFEEISNSIKAVFLLFIAISANFLGNTLSCNLQYNLTTIPYLRHIFLYLIIIFTIDFTSKNSLSVEEILTKSLIIYIFYIMLNKQDYITMYIVIIMLIITYLIYLQTNYLKKNNLDTIYYDNLSSNLIYGISFVTLIGFILYFNKQYNEHYNDFDILKFIFGPNVCNKIKTL